MEQIAEQITEKLIQDLPKETDFFTTQELLSYGIPIVVVETLRKNIASTIESGMKLPATDWVQTDSEKVTTAWKAFVETSKLHIRIPSAKISTLLGEAVEQCLELAVKPRQSVPEIIFKTRKTIDLETAKLRVDDLEVNQQLGLALLRYMEKKEKSELTKDQVCELIKKIDEKLVENYHPLNWAQALKPVFELAGPKVDSDLFRIFFEDKEMPGIARKFDLLEIELDETEFIERMSSAEMLDVDDFEDSQPQLFVSVEEEKSLPEPEGESEIENEAKTELSGEGEAPFEIEDEEEPEEEFIAEDENFEESDEDEHKAIENYDEPVDEEFEDAGPEVEEHEDEEVEEEPDQKDENIVNLFSQIKKGEAGENDLYYLEKEESGMTLVEPEDEDGDEDDNITLLNKFMFDESPSEDAADTEGQSENETRAKKEPSSIYEEMNLVKENRQETERMSEVFDEISEEDEGEKEESDEDLSYKIVSTEEDEPESVSEEPRSGENEIEEAEDKSEKEDEDDLPMWRSFLERDDMEAEFGYEYENEDEDEDDFEEELEDEEGFIEEPIYDLTAAEPDPEEKLRDISKWLDDEKDRFVEEIFRNSEIAYEQALIEILNFDDWKSASHYLEREVFSRNRIDVYDEAAVDFTDRLHSYFMENKS